jgi:hypothetical protein
LPVVHSAEPESSRARIARVRLQELQATGVFNDVGNQKVIVHAGVIVHCEHQLFEVIAALGTAGSGASLLDGGQEECEEYSDDGEDNKQFDQSEGAVTDRVTHGYPM